MGLICSNIIMGNSTLQLSTCKTIYCGLHHYQSTRCSSKSCKLLIGNTTTCTIFEMKGDYVELRVYIEAKTS